MKTNQQFRQQATNRAAYGIKQIRYDFYNFSENGSIIGTLFSVRFETLRFINELKMMR